MGKEWCYWLWSDLQSLFTFPRCRGKREQYPSQRLTSWALMWIPTKGEALIKDAIVNVVFPILRRWAPTLCYSLLGLQLVYWSIKIHEENGQQRIIWSICWVCSLSTLKLHWHQCKIYLTVRMRELYIKCFKYHARIIACCPADCVV